MTINVQADATQANSGILSATADNTTVAITGAKGTATFEFAAGTSVADMTTAINAETENTGVMVDAGGNLLSEDVGSDATVKVETMEGSGIGIANSEVTGTDIQATVNGETVSAQGNTLSIDVGGVQGTVTLEDTVTAGDTLSFDVEGGGLVFQLGDGSGEQVAVGINALNTATLGKTDDGTLASLRSGGANSLANNPDAAVDIIDQAIADVADQRADLGAFQTNTLETNQNALDVAFENLMASESELRDLDFAMGILTKIQEQLKQNVGVSLLAQSNFSQQSVINLLG
jgi:flagellin